MNASCLWKHRCLKCWQKYNEKVLVSAADNSEFVVKKKTITIFNVKNHIKADKLDKHRKIEMKFWTWMKMIKDERYSNHLEYGNFVYYLSHVCIPTLREILFVDFDRPIFPVAEEGGLVQTVACIDPSCKQAQWMPSFP